MCRRYKDASGWWGLKSSACNEEVDPGVFWVVFGYNDPLGGEIRGVKVVDCRVREIEPHGRTTQLPARQVAMGPRSVRGQARVAELHVEGIVAKHVICHWPDFPG